MRLHNQATTCASARMNNYNIGIHTPACVNHVCTNAYSFNLYERVKNTRVYKVKRFETYTNAYSFNLYEHVKNTRVYKVKRFETYTNMCNTRIYTCLNPFKCIHVRAYLIIIGVVLGSTHVQVISLYVY